MIKGNSFIHSSLFGKKKVFDNLYNENFVHSQDYELLLRIISKGYNIGYHPDNLLSYRVNSKGATHRRNSKCQEWLALKARWYAITKYAYPKKYLVYLLRPLISFLIPYRLKNLILFKIIT